MLAILTTHPIQYQVPLWQALAKDGSVPFEVWYLSDQATRPSFDSQFSKTFAWDLNTLSGYPYRFLQVNANHDVARFSRLRLAEPLREMLRKKGVRALWIQGWQVAAYWQAVWQAHAEGVPVWLRGESNDLAQRALWKTLPRNVLLRQLFKRIEYFLYIGKANRRLYESFGIRAEQLHPAPYCVDNERFATQAASLQQERAAIRGQLNIAEDAFCILFAGKFISVKRPLDLVEAVSQLNGRKLDRPVHLLWVGSGEIGQELRNRCHVAFDAESLSHQSNGSSVDGHKPSASFAGFLNQTEISRAYVAADCLVLPSAAETWGLVVNEAMASGLPSVVSNGCGCAEDLVVPIDAELCFPAGDVLALSRALARLSHEEIPYSRLKEQVEKFDVSRSVEVVKKLYSSVVGNNS